MKGHMEDWKTGRHRLLTTYEEVEQGELTASLLDEVGSKEESLTLS